MLPRVAQRRMRSLHHFPGPWTGSNLRFQPTANPLPHLPNISANLWSTSHASYGLRAVDECQTAHYPLARVLVIGRICGDYPRRHRVPAIPGQQVSASPVSATLPQVARRLGRPLALHEATDSTFGPKKIRHKGIECPVERARKRLVSASSSCSWCGCFLPHLSIPKYLRCQISST